LIEHFSSPPFSASGHFVPLSRGETRGAPSHPFWSCFFLIEMSFLHRRFPWKIWRHFPLPHDCFTKKSLRHSCMLLLSFSPTTFFPFRDDVRPPFRSMLHFFFFFPPVCPPFFWKKHRRFPQNRWAFLQKEPLFPFPLVGFPSEIVLCSTP